MLFALFPKSASVQADGLSGVYWAGAGLLLLAGNLLPVVLGRAWRALGVSRWVGVAGVALGVLGLVSVAVTLGWVPIGLTERISTYSFLLWQVLLAVALLTPGRG